MKKIQILFKVSLLFLTVAFWASSTECITHVSYPAALLHVTRRMVSACLVKHSILMAYSLQWPTNGYHMVCMMLDEQKVDDLGNACLLDEHKVDDLGNACVLDEQKADGLGDACVLDEQKADGLVDDCVLDEQKVECLVNDCMLDKHRAECLVDDCMLDEHRVECLGDTHIQKVECLVDDHKSAECLTYNQNADGYVDDNDTAECLVNDHPIAQCLGNAYMVNEKTGGSLFNDHFYAIWWVNNYPILVTAAFLDEYKATMENSRLKYYAVYAADGSMSILQLYLQIMLTLLDCVFVHNNTSICIARKCLLIKLKLNQNMVRRHDFKVYMQSMKFSSTTANGVALLIVSVFLYCQVLKVIQYPFVIIWKVIGITTVIARGVRLLRMSVILYIQSWKELHSQVVGLRKLLMTCDSQNILSDRCCNLNSSFIGGGKANEFSYHEIQPYAVSQNAFEASNKFKFVSHVLKDDIALYSNVESFVIVNDQSLKVLTPKFTIADLKTVAASHGVFFHSKMNHRTLQLAIEDHICQNCSTYVSVFEFIDKKVIVNERKLSHSIAVRKSKSKDPEKYKDQNMIAVQKYQSQDPEHHSQQHQAAVQKYNIRNPEIHSQQNLAAVQKFALEHPDKHSKQNLAAVQKFAINNPDKHSKQHQAAVEKFALKHPDKHSQQNLAAVQKFALENPDKHSKQHLAAVQKFALDNPDKHSKQHLAAVQKFAL